MQRNILKKGLICGIVLLLTFTPINNLYAAEEVIETNLNLDESVSGTYYVNAQHGLKMRSAPSTDADVVALLPYKAEVTVTGAATDSWYKVEYANQTGYVAATYITKSSTTNPNAEAEDTQTAETQEDTQSPEGSPENTTDTFGVTPIITALIAAIIIMAILALFTALSFLKNGNDSNNEEYDDEYDEEEHDDEYDEAAYDGEYDDEEYDDEEYDDEEP